MALSRDPVSKRRVRLNIRRNSFKGEITVKNLGKKRIKEIREALAEHMNAEGNADIGIAPDALEKILDMLEDAQTHGRRISNAATVLALEKANRLGVLRSMDATIGAKTLRTFAGEIARMDLKKALKENR